MVDRRVPGHPEAFKVTSVEVAAAKLQVKRARQRGLPVDSAVVAIAEAKPIEELAAQAAG